MTTKTTEIVVIGAGSAGSVVANRLSADGTRRVLLLEAGGWDWSPVFSVPAGEEKAIGNPIMPGPIARNRTPPATDGRRTGRPGVLGGSSSINGMIFLRGNRGDFDAWAKAGAAGWDYKSVLPYFKRLEHNFRGADAFRGADGPLSVSAVRTHWSRPSSRPRSRRATPTIPTSTARRSSALAPCRPRRNAAGATAPRAPISGRPSSAATSDARKPCHAPSRNGSR